ncbi:MAG: PHP domain-containing protein [Chloroflexi bacterium]|nr:PHP domain-containing protein [Chloroflexota bacterium]
MDAIFDLHVHTREGSLDSDLAPEHLVEAAQRLGLKGVLLAEHDGWQRHRFQAFAAQYDLVLVHALEIYTDMGHIITLGLDGYRPGIRRLAELRRVVEEVGGFMILAHPFRFFFGPHGRVTRNALFADPATLPQTAADALAHPAFALVDEMEVVNGGNMDEQENRFAQEVAARWGRPGTGGSDAHSLQGIARGATLFHGDIRHERDLLDALRAGAYTPLEGFNKGQVTFYGVPPVTVVTEDGVTTSSRILAVHRSEEHTGSAREGCP